MLLQVEARSQERIRPTTGDWRFAALERHLFESASEIPTWRLANKARQILADVVSQLSLRIETHSRVTDEHDAQTARELAAIHLGVLMVRSVGSIIALISSGYEPEALAPYRTTIEITFRGQQVLDDLSGEAARRLLARQPQIASLKRLAKRYGEPDEVVPLLDRLAHADVWALLPLVAASGDTGEDPIDPHPKRQVLRPASQLLSAGRRACDFADIAARIFGVEVEMPPWLAGELKRFRDHPLPSTM